MQLVKGAYYYRYRIGVHQIKFNEMFFFFRLFVYSRVLYGFTVLCFATNFTCNFKLCEGLSFYYRKDDIGRALVMKLQKLDVT